MIGILLIWLFMGTACYSIYSMWTPVVASNVAGIFGAGLVGGIIALFLDGISHMSAILNNVIALDADYGEYTFAAGFTLMLVVMLWNGASTSGRTLVQ